MTSYYLDPTNQAFIDAASKAGGTPLWEQGYVGARASLERLQKHDSATDVTATEFDVPTKANPGGKVKTVLYKPAGEQKGDLPTVIYTHGGGWILGSPSTHDRLLRDLVRETGYAFVFPYYTPAPDALYPTQIEESYAVLEWVGANGTSLGLKTDKFSIAGDSVGGHMALALSALTVERSGPKIVYQVLFYPVTSTNSEGATYKTYVNDAYLPPVLLHWMYGAFFGDGQKTDTPNYDSSLSKERATNIGSPILSTKEQLSKLPPTLIIVSGVDPLQDEGEQFGHKLQAAGVPTAIFRADGQIHDYVMLNPIAKSPTATAAIELAALKLKKSLA